MGQSVFPLREQCVWCLGQDFYLVLHTLHLIFIILHKYDIYNINLIYRMSTQCYNRRKGGIPMVQNNLEEKIALLTGKGMWHTHETAGLPSIHLSDGPHGAGAPEQYQSGIHLLSDRQRPCLLLGLNSGGAVGNICCQRGLERGYFRSSGSRNQHQALPALRQKL